MQLVMRIEKSNPPTRTAMCEAGALAVVALLADPNCQPGHPWYDPVTTWTDGRIRKHVRRARGSAWNRAQTVPGITVTHQGAQIRACVPTPVTDIPADIRRLQLTGSVLPDPPKSPTPEVPHMVRIALTADPMLSLGKAVAAAGHASQLAVNAMTEEQHAEWTNAGYPLTVAHPTLSEWIKQFEHAEVVVTDAGFTEVEPNTVTAIATWT